MAFEKSTSYFLFSFSKIPNISAKKIQNLCQYKGSNPKNRLLKLKKNHNTYIFKQFNVNTLTKSKIRKKLFFFWNIKLYRGIRHMLRLPSRGQRTRTNAKTKKKFKFS
jgi:small subunit ribosomal protein S13